MFHKTSLKLAGLYLAIMMLISVSFSFSLYQVSVQELNRGFQRQADLFDSVFRLPRSRPRFELQNDRALNEAKARVISHLVLTNLLILVIAGALSYLLAHLTLQPIEEQQEAQARFTADAAHELRTPLAAMQTENEVALRNPKLSLADARAQLRSNLEELARLSGLSENLLRLARLEGGELPKQVVETERIVRDAVQRVLPLAEAKQILLETKVPDKLPVLADESSLVESLVVLLDNAIKFSPSKTTIRVEAATQAKEAVIKVIDHGIGIKPEQREHIFERFYQASASRSKTERKGYGLGLAIAHNIVTVHGGRIAVSSVPGKGSTFAIHLPKR